MRYRTNADPGSIAIPFARVGRVRQGIFDGLGSAGYMTLCMTMLLWSHSRTGGPIAGGAIRMGSPLDPLGKEQQWLKGD